uniref:Uncharacterized protein n=1 Tax=Timema bartmani TaxID=61472 RepID=A0A7R9FAH4_9NEOP|nr:unnamed protein product [Timema bartmani]
MDANPSRYFDEISQDTGKYCFGVVDTLRALELGSVETLICWENLDIQRYVLKNHATAEEKILHLTPEQEKDKTHFTDKESGVELELVECQPLLEWLANNYKSFGATLEIITDKSQEGSQFVRGFGGIGEYKNMLRFINVVKVLHICKSTLRSMNHAHYKNWNQHLRKSMIHTRYKNWNQHLRKSTPCERLRTIEEVEKNPSEKKIDIAKLLELPPFTLNTIISNKTDIRAQAGLLRYKVDFQSMQLDDLPPDAEYDLDDY